ncbi:MAG: LamB/YcsF family protein [Dehalococcoidia bacterium]
MQIDLNADIGESYGVYNLGDDENIVEIISSANIATGFHAGDPNHMKRTVDLCEKNDVGIGAHPAYPDKLGFGRRDMYLETEEISNILTYQIGALIGFTKQKKIQHVKPHGALYNAAVKDERIATAIVKAIMKFDPELIHVVLAGSLWEEIAKSKNARVARECFADRAVNSDGSLVSRSLPGAIIDDLDEIIKRSKKLVIDGKVTANNGVEIDFVADSICVHGDNPQAILVANSLRRSFLDEGIKILPLTKMENI